MSGSGETGLGASDDVHAARVLVELDVAIDEGKERVVTANADPEPRMDFRPALADENVAGYDGLAAGFFQAEALAA